MTTIHRMALQSQWMFLGCNILSAQYVNERIEVNVIAVVYTTYFNEINEKSVFHTYKVKVVP